MKKKTFKGSIESLGPAALTLVIAVIIIAVGAMILGGMKDNVTDANATTVLNKGLSAMVSFSDWFGVLVVIVVAVIILALVMLIPRLQNRGSV